MNKLLKKSLAFFAALFILLSLFFFWASSSTYPKNDYALLLQNNFEQQLTSDSIYSIVTYNIGYLSGMTNNKALSKPKLLFENNLIHVKNEINSLKPDILAFQEIDFEASRSYHINQQNEIATLGYNYVAQAINWDKRYVPFPYWPPALHFGKVLSGQSILSKYPIIKHQRLVLERDVSNPFYRDALYLDRLAQVASIVIDKKELIIINVHLEAYNKETRIKQFNSVLDLYFKYADKNPTILLGDFNSPAGDGTSIIQKLIDDPKVGNAAYQNKLEEFTFDSKAPYKRIDYIFYSKNFIEYINGKILTEFEQASDHLPVMMQFKLK